MNRKFFVVMMTVFCMVLGGCGEKNTYPNDSYGSSYESEDASSDEEEYSESEDEYMEDDVDTPGESDAEEAEEISGIVGMIQKYDPNRAVAITQIVTINPDTGEQAIISEFTLKCPTATEISSPDTVDDSELRFFLPEFNAEVRSSGNHRDWFSEDFDKMIATRVFLNRANEQHAGWMDDDGNYFDVAESIGAVTESSFSNPDPVKQTAAGFEDGKFIFCEGSTPDEHVCYCVPVTNTSEDALSILDTRYGYFENLYHGVVIAYPTYWLNDQECIADVYDHSDSPNSIRANIETGEFTEYLPDSERYNWSGILNPAQDTVAFLSTAQRADGVVELYTMPLEGGEPEKVPIVPNDELVLDTTRLTQKDLYGLVSQRNYINCYFCLLEWR